MNINVIGVPLFFGCDRKGVDLAPNKLREKGLIKIIENNGNKVSDLGNILVKERDEKDKYAYHNNMKYVDSIIEVDKSLAEKVYSSLNDKAFPLIIGGDHALGLGSICGASKYFKEDLAVIWIDAHGDINTDENSPSGNVHGMPLAAAMGFGNECLTDLYFKGRKVKPENVFLIGARDLDHGELELIEKEHLNVYSTKEVKERGIKAILEDVNKKLNEKAINNVHLSFDIDCIDPSFAPGTGTPVVDGLTVEEAKTSLTYLLNTNKIKSMDFVELNTELENGDTTIELCLDLIDLISKNIK